MVKIRIRGEMANSLIEIESSEKETWEEAIEEILEFSSKFKLPYEPRAYKRLIEQFAKYLEEK